jgi:hypothetical protein
MSARVLAETVEQLQAGVHRLRTGNGDTQPRRELDDGPGEAVDLEGPPFSRSWSVDVL